MRIPMPVDDDRDDDPAEQGKWGERDLPQGDNEDPRDYQPDWGSDEPDAARQSER